MTRGSLELADSELIGRDVESARIDALIDGLPEGGAALVVSGAAGVGKSALLRYARARADALGLRTLATVGVESEAELAFAGLHQLLYPALGLMELLPAPQRRALEVAFGIASGPEPVAFLVALRTGFATPLGVTGLPALELDRLSPSAAAALLDRRAPDLHPVFRARVLAEAAGNPLALVELVRARPEPGTFDGLG